MGFRRTGCSRTKRRSRRSIRRSRPLAAAIADTDSHHQNNSNSSSKDSPPLETPAEVLDKTPRDTAADTESSNSNKMWQAAGEQETNTDSNNSNHHKPKVF